MTWALKVVNFQRNVLHIGIAPDVRRTSALVTEWSQ